MVWREWGTGRPLLLLHGGSGSWTHWIHNVLPLAAHRRVLAPDMPGFGESDAPPEPHTAEAVAALVAAGLEAVVPADQGLDIAGFSFGGIIAALVAARLGARVGVLALLGPGGFGLTTPPMRPLHRVRGDMAAKEIRRAHRENLGILMLADPMRVDDLAVDLQMDNVRRARFKVGAIPESDVLLRALPHIRARLTALWGERDAFAGDQIEACRRLLASIHREADVRVIGGAGHWIGYEAADEVNRALVAVLPSPTESPRRRGG
jgi:pimeloyl-ACP methyl ester carboxylesterase